MATPKLRVKRSFFGRKKVATNYERGRAFEYRTRKRLTEMGAGYIMRAASSKGAADLMVLWPIPEHRIVDEWLAYEAQRPWLVQCKMDGKLPKKEREEIVRIADLTGARPVLAYKNKKRKLVFREITLSGDGRQIIQVIP